MDIGKKRICGRIGRTAGLMEVLGLKSAFCQGFPPDPRVDQIFSQWDKPNSPGVSVAVARRGTIVYSRGYGIADLDHGIANTPRTVFHAASLAKQFTAMCVLLLVGQRALKLEEKAHDYVPELPDFGITIADMLHHISGLRDQWVLVTMAGWRMSDDVVTRDDVLNLVKRMKTLNFDAGTRYSYSNTNYTLAGLIVERVSGLSLPEFAWKHIFTPLGMTSTRITSTHGEILPNRACGYRGAYPNFEIRMPNYDLTGPTNLLTTVEDLIKWDSNFESKLVGGDAAVTAMQTPVANSGAYGMGLFVTREQGRLVVEHDGRDAGYNSHFIRFPEDHLTVALLCNVRLPDATPTRVLVRKVADVFLGSALATEIASVEEVPLAASTGADPADYLGRYYSDEIDTSYEIQIASPLTFERAKYPPTDLTPTANDKFTMMNFSNVLPKASVQFHRDAQGRIAGFSIDDISGANRLSDFRFTKLP